MPRSPHSRATPATAGGGTAITARRPAKAPRLLLGRVLGNAEEPQVEIVQGHCLVHPAHGRKVIRGRGPDLDSGTVGQQRENARVSW
jgi:hypothetical protein